MHTGWWSSPDRPARPAEALDQRRAKRRELLLQVRRHLLDGRLPDEAAQLDLEAVAPGAVAAVVEMALRLDPLRLVQLAVEERLQELLALLAWIDTRTERHHAVLPTVRSASSRFRIRRPRWRRDITVPIGMSRICAASA